MNGHERKGGRLKGERPVDAERRLRVGYARGSGVGRQTDYRERGTCQCRPTGSELMTEPSESERYAGLAGDDGIYERQKVVVSFGKTAWDATGGW